MDSSTLLSNNSKQASHIFHRCDQESLLQLVNNLNTFFKGDSTFEIKYFGDTNNVTKLIPGMMFLGCFRINCKNVSYVYLQKTKKTITATAEKTKQQIANAKEPFLKIHGNILYSLNYHSYIDTPFAQSDVYQHSLQSYLDVTIKNQYPIRVYINSNFGNSPLLRNFTNLNFQYNSSQFVNNIKNNLKIWAANELKQQLGLEKLKGELEQQHAKVEQLSGWLHAPINYQKIVEEREAAYVSNNLKSNPSENDSTFSAAKNIFNSSTSLTQHSQFSSSNPLTAAHGKSQNADSNNIQEKISDQETKFDSSKAVTSFEQYYQKQQALYDTLSKRYDSALAKYQQEQKLFSKTRDSIVQQIQNVKNIDELRQKLKDADLPDSVLPKGYRNLLAIRSFGIGTMPVNYSELTIKNISITGIEAEYNPSYYIAFATGTISYRFRDYFINNREEPKQYVSAVRIGKGQVDGTHIIFTWYTGKKFVYPVGISSNDSVAAQPGYLLSGFSVETRYQLNKNNSLIAEYAKSTIPYYSNAAIKNNSIASVFRFTDRSNEAYSVKLQSYIPQTQTKLTANYKRLGTNFQSFSLFSNSATQHAWYIKLSQPLFKRKLMIDASLRQNDFTNPYVAQQLNSKTIFKSVQATLRLQKFPTLSIGYFPSSQLIKISDDAIIENLFYTLIGTAVYGYHTKHAQMYSSLIYTQFYNKQADSNFIYFNTKNLAFNQNIYLRKLNLEENISVDVNQLYKLYVVGSGLDYRILKSFSLGAGLKLNYQTLYNTTLIGYTLRTTFALPKIGTIGIAYDKGYMPGVFRNLVPNEVGRMTYSKIF